MQEALIHTSPHLHSTTHTHPLPPLTPTTLLIRVSAASANVKDWLHPTLLSLPPLNSGDDLSGTVVAMGSAVAAEAETETETETGRLFKIGDRVAAMHPMLEQPGGAYAEYARAPADTTLRIPGDVSFAEGATIPLVAITAGLSLFRRLGLRAPWTSTQPQTKTTIPTPTPLIVYGASSALGCYAIKLARLSNIHPIIAIAGSSSAYVSTLLSPAKGDKLLDYRVGETQLLADVRAALDGIPAQHGIDCISSNGTWVLVSKMLGSDGEEGGEGAQLSVVSGAHKYDDAGIKPGVRIIYTYVGTAHSGAYKPGMPKQPTKEEAAGDRGFVREFVGFLERVLGEGVVEGGGKEGEREEGKRRRAFEGHPFEIVPGGLEGVGEGLRRLKAGEARGRKFVFLIREEEEKKKKGEE
ncbi:MAG: hypothetical protein M1834_001970 [Cirrosporium novae-zelandiae]|nr:MAG: hypothetical protein M1834_001970 [Cirrosporium novae-zelandiae]